MTSEVPIENCKLIDKRKLFIFLMMIYAISFFIPLGHSIPVLVTPNNVTVYNNGIQFKERNFYSNYSEMFWVFGHFGQSFIEGDVTGHAYSKDGINWNIIDDSFQSLNVWHDTVTNYGWDFHFEPNGRYFWVAWQYTHASPDYLYVARGEMHTNGTISFPEGRQFVRDTFGSKNFIGYVCISSDSNGYPFVAYTSQTGSDYYGYIEWSDTNDGTWDNGGRDPNAFTTSDPKDAYTPQHHKVCKLEKGRMSWTMMVEDLNGYWYVDTIFYSGSAWEIDQQTRLFYDAAVMGINAERRVDITSYGDITVGAYVRRSAGYQKMSCAVVDYSGSWENNTIIKGNYPELVGNWVPSVTVSENGSIYVFAFKSADEYYVNYTRRFSNYTWEGSWNIYYDDPDKIYSHNTFHIHETYDEYISLWFHDGTNDGEDPGDNEIYHDYIGEYIPEPVEYLTVTLIDAVEFDWGSGFGDSQFNYTDYFWVFEGKTRYRFKIVYEPDTLGTVKQVGVRFTDDGDQTHTIWYDEDANTLNVTSPNDSISGWVQSFDQEDSKLTVTFQIMFNKPIPDSYAIQLEVRVVADDDTSWMTPSDGIFNIYNLGGLATLYSIGTAGRVTGGDIFEIYAADSRTNIEGSHYFDVREDPLSWYNVLTNEDMLIDEMSPDWEFNLPRRTSSTTIRLTNNLPEDRTSPQTRTYDTPGTDDMAYVSYPFGMRLLSDPFLSGDYQIGAELTFPRELTSDDGTLYVQAYMMNPNTTHTTGAFRVRDGSRLDSGTWILSDVQFNGNGSWVSYNRTASTWLYYSNYEAYTWYNVTVAINLTAANYDIFIDDVEVVSNLPYRSEYPETAYVIEFTQFVPTAGAPDDAFLDFYVDNVRHRTDFDADYGGVAEATMLFDKNQHWSMDFDFFIEDGSVYAQGESATPLISRDDYSDHGYLEFGWDVMIDKVLVHDFLVARVNISDGRISGKNNWVEFTITWYERGEIVKDDILYGLFEGYSIFPGGERDTTGFHWDIWLNRANASTVIGARMNTEYYGLSDKSVWWAVWSSKWLPMRSEVSESTLFIDLRDADGTIHSANDVSFVRSWVKVYRTSDSQFSYKVLNIAGLDFLIAVDTMSGIDTPPIRETLVPDVPSGFFGSALGAIFSAALKRLGNTLAGFGMGFFTMSVEFIDNIFAALGYPALVSTIFGWMDSLFANVPTLLGYGLTLIDQIFRMINISATNTLTQLTSIITIWIGMYSTVMDLLTGALTPGINLWNDLGINSFIRIGAILYPLWLLMMASDKGGQAVIDHLSGVLNIGSFFLNIILGVTDLFVKLLTGLIGAIRG